MRRLFGLILSALILLSGPALAASTINSLPTVSFPLPDAGNPSTSTLNLWIANGNGPNSDFRVTPLQLGYILQNCSPPSSPFRYELWWNTCTNPAVEAVYTGTAWATIGTLDYVSNIWSPAGGSGGSGGIGTIASAPTTDLGTVLNAVVKVTGGASITSLGSTAQAGTIKYLIFSGTPTLVYNSSTLLVPGAANLVTSTNDTAVAIALGAGAWQIASYQPAASLYATLVSPAFTGTPTAPTATPGTNTPQLATTGFVATSFAPLNSPTFTGTPTAPTPDANDNSSRLATTGFITPTFAPLISPSLSGTPTAPTATPGTNTPQLATTAFVATSFAPLNSPAFTGTPTAPTPAGNDNSTNLATTAFVATSFVPSNSPTFSGTVTLPDGSTWGSGGLTAVGNPLPIIALANINTNTILANTTSGSAPPASVTPGAVGAILCQPEAQIYGSSAGTYTTPTCNGVTAQWLRVRMCGGGGGSGGTGSGATDGGGGGATTFGSAFLSAGGGSPTTANNGQGASGGSASGGDFGIAGGYGNSSAITSPTLGVSGGNGGVSPFGGAGAGGLLTDGTAGAANSCSGGGGGGATSSAAAEGGGGAGAYLEKFVSLPASSYVYSIGAGGSAGTIGASGRDGKGGGSGLLIILAGWQ